MWKYFSNLFLALFEGHSIGNSKKNFEIWKFVKKIFFGQEPKWWVKRSLGSFVKKFLLEACAEKLHLKIFLEATFRKSQAFLKTQKIHCAHICRNFEPKWCPSRQNEVELHNVPLDFPCDQRLTSYDDNSLTFGPHCIIPYCLSFWSTPFGSFSVW